MFGPVYSLHCISVGGSRIFFKGGGAGRREASSSHLTLGPQQGGGGLLPTGGIVGKEQPRHEKAIPMGPTLQK